MRINEDFIENIEDDDISLPLDATERVFNDKDMYRFSFFFVSKPTDISYVTEDRWKSISDELHRILYKFLDSSPVITEYRHLFPLYVALSYYENLNRRDVVKTIENNGNDILFYETNIPVSKRQALSFMISFDARIRTLDKLRILILFLWKTFKVISRQTFIPEPQNITLCTVGGGYNDRPTINENNYQIWLRKSSDENSRKRYIAFMRAIRPELRGKVLNDMVDEFLKDSEDADIAELVNRMHKETDGVSYRLIDKALQNVRLDGDTLVITKDKFNACCKHDVDLLKKTTVKFRVEGLEKLQYGIYEYGEKETLKSIRKTFEWLDSVFIGNWKVEIYVRLTRFYEQFPDRVVDFRTITDNHTVKFKRPGQYERTLYTSELNLRNFTISRNQETLTFEVIDSFKTHKVVFEVKRSDWWMNP